MVDTTSKWEDELGRWLKPFGGGQHIFYDWRPASTLA